MMGQMSPAQCCCTNCEDCCNGNDPAEFDVELTYTDDQCENCDTFVSGVYTLAKLGPCRWVYQSGLIAGEYCEGIYPSHSDIIYQIDVVLTVACVSATEYRIRLEVVVYRSYFTGTETQYSGAVSYSTYNGIASDTYRYEATVPFGSFTCNAVTNYSLPFVSKTAFRSFYYNTMFGPSFVMFTAPPNATSESGWDIVYNCDPGSSALLTGVP